MGFELMIAPCFIRGALVTEAKKAYHDRYMSFHECCATETSENVTTRFKVTAMSTQERAYFGKVMQVVLTEWERGLRVSDRYRI